MAEEGRALLYDVGVGLGFLATVRLDGGPRVHPMCPLVSDEGLFAFIVPSPKLRDLHRGGRYALHSVPLELTRMRSTAQGAPSKLRTRRVATVSVGSSLKRELLSEFQRPTTIITCSSGTSRWRC
jgi:hypothetical protein